MLWRVGTRLGTGRRIEGGGPEESRGSAASKAEVAARQSQTCAAGLPGLQAATARGTPESPTRGWQVQGLCGWLRSGGTAR